MKETQIKRAIIDFLRFQKDCEVFPTLTGGMYNPKTKSYRPTMTRAGTPDLLVCYRGRFVGLEVKTAKGRLSDKQKLMIDAIEASGGVAAVVRSIEDVRKVLDGISEISLT